MIRYPFSLLLTLCTLPLRAATTTAPQTDLLSFAQGAVPVRIVGGEVYKVNDTHAMGAIDGDPRGFTFASKAPADARVDFIYRLPAMTTFHRLAVPTVPETPSPAQTFAREVEVSGSTEGADGPYRLLGRTELKAHDARGEVTELKMTDPHPVRWVKLSLTGGIDVERVEMFYEFSEIIGNGEQEAVPLSTAFDGAWTGRGVKLKLGQDGAVVSGCYDRDGQLQGTVDGNILRARGITRGNRVESLFVLTVDDAGAISGVRSTNGGPFHPYHGDPTTGDAGTRCSRPAAPALGCGSVIQAIRFDYDSAGIRPESAPVLDALAQGLDSGSGTKIAIIGHTSSEGSDDYNQNLSERRAASVIDALVERGIARDRTTSMGRGESEPIASNDSEAGRSMNRRVQVLCQE